MKIFCIIVLLAAVCAEPPVPEAFAGYERGGYEIQGREQEKTFPGADQLNFPPTSDVTGGSGSAGGSGGRPGVSGSQSPELQDDFSSGLRDGLGVGGERLRQQQRGSGRFEGASDGEGEGGEGSLDDIPGVAGKDYPIYGEIPTTSFSCDQQTAPGYYADVEAQCQVFHICQKGGQKNSVLCPNGTIFNQKVFVCSWWYDFDCDSAPGLFSLNEQNSAEADAASSRGGQGGGARGGAGGYAENGPNGGGFRDNGGNSIASAGYTDDSQKFDQGNREPLENDINGGQNAFGGYQENGPVKLTDFPRSEQNGGVPELQNGPSSRGSGRFSSTGQNRGNNNGQFEGYSENGPNQEGSRNDLTTSGGFSGRLGLEPSSSGYSVSDEGGAGYPRGRNGNTRGRNGNSGSRYEGSSGSDDGQLAASRDQGSDNGYPSEGTSGVRGGLDQSSQYLPPGESASGSQNGNGGFNNDATLTTDRNYLPPS